MGRLTFRHGLAISVALHACLAAPLFLPDLFPRQQPRNDKLVVEMFGMIANRQTQEKQLGAEAAPPVPAVQAQAAPPPPPPPREEERKREPEAKRPVERTKPKADTARADSPVRVRGRVETPAAAVPPPQPTSRAPASSPPSPPVAPGENERQVQQTIRHETEAERIKRYLAGVKRRLTDKFAYPEELRRSGFSGIPKVAFVITADGGIREGSLRIVRSSGSPIVDVNALESVLSAAPFEPPPREIPLAVEPTYTASR